MFDQESDRKFPTESVIQDLPQTVFTDIMESEGEGTENHNLSFEEVDLRIPTKNGKNNETFND